MLKPTDDELQAALAEAERLRGQDTDPHHLARSLQYLAHRVRLLETVYEAAKNYLHFGQEEHDHALLANAIEAVRNDESHATGDEEQTLGL